VGWITTHIFGLIDTMDIGEFDGLALGWFELRLARTSFHETGILEEDG
jgi:hypothetical protein